MKRTSIIQGDVKCTFYYTKQLVVPNQTAVDVSNMHTSRCMPHHRMFEKVAAEVVRCDLRSFYPEALSNIVWAYATIKLLHHRLFQIEVVRRDLRSFVDSCSHHHNKTIKPHHRRKSSNLRNITHLMSFILIIMYHRFEPRRPPTCGHGFGHRQPISMPAEQKNQQQLA